MHPLVPPTPYSNTAPNYLVDGTTLFAVNGKNLLNFDLAGGKTASTVALPDAMVQNIYPPLQ